MMVRRATNRATANDLAIYTTALRRIAPLDDRDIREGFDLTHVRELSRGDYLLRAGENASEVAVVVRGLLREHFIVDGGVERTKAFIAEGSITGSLADLLSARPSRAFIVTQEAARILVTDYAAYEALCARSPAWDRFRLRAVERLLLQKAEREFELLALDAWERYAALRAAWPGIETRVAECDIASYLGITAVHLSRLRRRRRAQRGAPA